MDDNVLLIIMKWPFYPCLFEIHMHCAVWNDEFSHIMWYFNQLVGPFLSIIRHENYWWLNVHAYAIFIFGMALNLIFPFFSILKLGREGEQNEKLWVTELLNFFILFVRIAKWVHKELIWKIKYSFGCSNVLYRVVLISIFFSVPLKFRIRDLRIFHGSVIAMLTTEVVVELAEVWFEALSFPREVWICLWC